MHTEDLIIDHNAQREEVEHVREIVPDIGVAVLPHALGIETVRLRDPPGFMVPSDQMHPRGVSQFQTNKQRDRLDTKQASVDIVAWFKVSESLDDA